MTDDQLKIQIYRHKKAKPKKHLHLPLAMSTFLKILKAALIGLQVKGAELIFFLEIKTFFKNLRDKCCTRERS
jgi:hypothetical protein